MVYGQPSLFCPFINLHDVSLLFSRLVLWGGV